MIEKQDFEKIIKKIECFPELEPPPGIVDNVMAKVTTPKRNWLTKSLQFLFTTRRVSFRPATLAVSVSILLFVGYLAPFNQHGDSKVDTKFLKKDFLSQAMQNSEASFLMGRGLMTAGFVKEALPLLHKASINEPKNPEYALWSGLCYAANDMPTEERSSYLRAIDSSPESPTLLLNLGHSFLEERQYDDALTYYNQVLSIDDTEQVALYNKALVFHLQKKENDEQAAWKTYLEQYRYGLNAFRAVQHLNNLNDFTYRIYYIGTLKIILNQKELLNISSLQKPTYNADKLARYLRQNPSLNLDIVSYHADGSSIAKQKADQLKQLLVNRLEPRLKNRIRLSWFGEKETLKTLTGNKKLFESILIFATNSDHLKKETTI